MPIHDLTRRTFLSLMPGLVGVAAAARFARAQPPAVTNPRATDGDARREPNWEERLTVTVGPSKADLVGAGDKVLQAAVDYIARLGGGTVHVLPGTYTLRSPVFLRPRVRLLGSGEDSVITKIASETVELAEDSDWYDQEITLKEQKSFRVGDAVVLRAKDPHDGGQTVIKRRLIARSGNRFKLDDGLRENLWLSGEPTCASLFPLLTSERTADVVIENIALDGNKEQNGNLNGNYAGCIFLQDCNRYTIRGVTARNYNGDGISFQVCHDVVVERCHSHDNADLGVHPGSGSQRPIIRDNVLARNRLGLFWCWGVKYGLAERNKIVDNRDYGVSIGHNDTDNVMRKNEITGSGKVGVLFRDEGRGKDFWPNRNVLVENKIADSGGDEGIAIDIQGRTRDLKIVRNQILETRSPGKRVGIRIAATAGNVEMEGNKFEGLATDVADLRQT
jgi:hypothetical protein